jgi:hypothetical protein
MEADGDAGVRPKDVPDRVLYAEVRMAVPESYGIIGGKQKASAGLASWECREKG